MRFLVTYPNGTTEVCTSEAETPEAYAMMHFGVALETYGGTVESYPEQDPPADHVGIPPADHVGIPPSDHVGIPPADHVGIPPSDHVGIPPAEGVSATVHSTSL